MQILVMRLTRTHAQMPYHRQLERAASFPACCEISRALPHILALSVLLLPLGDSAAECAAHLQSTGQRIDMSTLAWVRVTCTATLGHICCCCCYCCLLSAAGEVHLQALSDPSPAQRRQRLQGRCALQVGYSRQPRSPVQHTRRCQWLPLCSRNLWGLCFLLLLTF